MPLSSLPDECFISVLSFLGKESLYKCLFVNRYYCKLSIPIIWRDPFTRLNDDDNISLISTLFSCLNEDEISSLIPFAMNLTNFNNQPPLFEYGKFIRKIDHGYFIDHVMAWFYSFNRRVLYNQDCRIQKLTDAIYHMIMRMGSNLQKFVIYSSQDGYYFDLPKFSIFTTYTPGITDLRSLYLYYNDYITNNMKYQNTLEFLNTVSKFCNCIIKFELHTGFIDNYQVLDIIKLQPLKSISLFDDHNRSIKKVLYTLEEFRSETLKELSFDDIDFQQIDLSSISKLECLEKLEFVDCTGFTFKKKLYLKELKLWHHDNSKLHAVSSIINFLCSEVLLKLSLNIITSDTVKVVKENCPNVKFLCTEYSGNDSLVPLICELPSLKTLKIKSNRINESSLIKLLSNHLISIEHLFLNFYVSLEQFEYFVNNCQTNLKRLDIVINVYSGTYRKDYLVHVYNFQKIHNSLKIFGIGYYKFRFYWIDEEIEIVNLLKNQGVDIVSIDYDE